MLMSKSASRKQFIIGGAFVALAAVGLYGILPRMGDFRTSLTVLSSARPGLVVMAAAASILSALCSAAIYRVLSMKRLRFSDTLLVQLAGLLVNRVLPAGVGGVSLNYLYLRAHKHTVAQASSVVALNNSIGFMGHMLLAIALLAIAPAAFSTADWPTSWPVVGMCVLIGLGIIVFVLYRWRPTWFRSLKRVIMYYAKRPVRLMKSMGLSLLLTLSNVMSLWLCCYALGVSLSFLAVFVAFTLGIAVGTATPTPGGLGGVEAALVGALVVQDVPAALALAIALLYRLVSYWFGLIVGSLALWRVSRRGLLT